jgi:rhomboid protease GluP
MDQDNSVEQQGEQKQKRQSPLQAFIPKGDYFFTPIILVLNILVFVVMVISGVSPTEPTNDALIKWGANFRPLTLDGQAWRLFTSMFLHIGIFHIFINMYSLYSLGIMLEKFIGKWRFIGLYLFTGLCGSVLSIWWNPETVSAGASGAIFGLFGVFVAIVTTNIIEPTIRKQLLRNIGITLLLNAGISFWANVDTSAHLGGFLSGLIGGYLIYFDLVSFYHRRKNQFIGLFISLALLTGIIIFFWKITPRTMVAGKSDTDVLIERYDSERIAAIKFSSAIDSSATLEEVNKNITKRWAHCLSLIDSMKNHGLSSEGEKYMEELRKSTLWGAESAKFYERSFKEHRKYLIYI